MARNNLGFIEGSSGNHYLAMKHFLIAARAGDPLSLENVKKGYTIGHVTKDEYANTLRTYQKAQDERKSKEREKAAEIQEHFDDHKNWHIGSVTL